MEEVPEGDREFTLTLALADDGKVTGTFVSDMGEGEILEARYNPHTHDLSFAYDAQGMLLEFAAQVGESTMGGTVDVGAGMVILDFEAKRTKSPEPKIVAEVPPEVSRPPESSAPQSLTELLPGPRWISSLEASLFEKDRVYVTFDGHRSDDDEPYVFVSENQGKTWRSIRANLPTSVGSTRVIREDIENPDILYLGTEFGAWVSIDRGASWTKFNSNLPTVAVHEFAIHPTTGEIVAGTHGRSLWILDVTPLRQMAKTLNSNDGIYLYKPGPAIHWRWEPRRGASGTRRFVGENPRSGAEIYYSLKEDADEITLKITDLAGKTLRELNAKSSAGLHRVTWDLRRAPDKRRGSSRGGRRPRRGPLVPAGKYQVLLTVHDETFTRKLTVETDPDYPNYRAWELEHSE